MGNSNMYESLAYDIVGIKLPNGKVQVVKNNYGTSGQILESENEFISQFQPLNESKGAQCIVMETING